MNVIMIISNTIGILTVAALTVVAVAMAADLIKSVVEDIKINKIIEDDTLASFDGTISVNGTDLGFGTVNVVRVTDDQLNNLFARN